MRGDQVLYHGMQRLIQSRQHSGGSGKTFYYRFAVDSPTQNHYRNAHIGNGVRGVCHADELSYLFKNIYVDLPAKNSMEFTAITRFVYLTSIFIQITAGIYRIFILSKGFAVHIIRRNRESKRQHYQC